MSPTPNEITARIARAGFAPQPVSAVIAVSAWCVRHGVSGAPGEVENAVQLSRNGLSDAERETLGALMWSHVPNPPAWVFEALGRATAMRAA